MVRIGDKPMMVYLVFRNDEIVYIGQTRMNIEDKMESMLEKVERGKGSVLGAAMRKHGFDSFLWKVHSTHYCQTDCDQYEKILINAYKPKYNS
jgi:hypothetical protein